MRILQQRIERGEEFSGGGDEGDFAGFAGGAAAPAAGKVAHLPRIDHREGLACGAQSGDHRTFPTAGRLAEHLHGRADALQAGEPCRAARRIVREVPGVALEVEVEGGL